ncbi:MAG: group 1 glycosyl transferase [archaeon GW2011_AR13]|nr:MAG: group 1 glycosyl transferase [archaeon GW2011_AR13]
MFGWEFPPFHTGGLGTACEGLTKCLSKNGVELIFVLPKKLDLNVDFLKVVYADDNIPIKKQYYFNSIIQGYTTHKSYENKYELEKEKDLIYASNLNEEVERYGLVAKRIAEEETFDIIHAHDWLTFKAGMMAKRVSGKKLVVHVHATEFDRCGGQGCNQHVYDIEKKGMQEADQIIAISDYTKKQIVKHYGISPKKVIVIHNGTQFEEFILNEVSNLKKSKKIVLSLGRITLQKGIDYLISAARIVLKYDRNVIFVIAGNGDMYEEIVRKVSDMGIADNFIFTGWVKDKNEIKKMYSMADLFIMPSVSEPFGLVPLEAQMCGTPSLISKQSGVAEIFSNCLKADFWDVNDMADKIVAVLKYNELHKTLNENGKEEVKKLTWDKPAVRCMDLYKKMMEEVN